MQTEIIIIPCLADNYAYLIHDKSSNRNTLVDAPEFAPIMATLTQNNWKLDNILITHHHSDHINAINALRDKFPAVVFGAKADSYRIPGIDVELSNKDKFSASNLIFKCIEVPGHTVGHLAFYCVSEKIIFTGDSLMSLGCGRLFEGSPKQMLSSLDLLVQLPEDTMIYSGHEYAINNAKFALSVDPKNSDLIERSKKISKNVSLKIPNVPTSLKEEKDTNPFLRADSSKIRQNLKINQLSKLEIFTMLRRMKDDF